MLRPLDGRRKGFAVGPASLVMYLSLNERREEHERECVISEEHEHECVISEEHEYDCVISDERASSTRDRGACMGEDPWMGDG